jgi:hypothetical protein
MATDLVAIKSAEWCEVAERGIPDIWRACKKLAIAVSTAVALAGAASAQTTPASSSTSASATADKGFWAWQYTKDGREFAKLSDEEVGKLDVREKIAYKKWSIANEQQKTITIGKLADKEWEKAIITRNQIIAEWGNISSQPESIVLLALRKDPEKSKQFLQYVISQNLPPPGRAMLLLQKLS